MNGMGFLLSSDFLKNMSKLDPECKPQPCSINRRQRSGDEIVSELLNQYGLYEKWEQMCQRKDLDALTRLNVLLRTLVKRELAKIENQPEEVKADEEDNNNASGEDDDNNGSGEEEDDDDDNDNNGSGEDDDNASGEDDDDDNNGSGEEEEDEDNNGSDEDEDNNGSDESSEPEPFSKLELTRALDVLDVAESQFDLFKLKEELEEKDEEDDDDNGSGEEEEDDDDNNGSGEEEDNDGPDITKPSSSITWVSDPYVKFAILVSWILILLRLLF